MPQHATIKNYNHQHKIMKNYQKLIISTSYIILGSFDYQNDSIHVCQFFILSFTIISYND